MNKELEAYHNIHRERPQYFSLLYDLDMWKDDMAIIRKGLITLKYLKEAYKKGIFSLECREYKNKFIFVIRDSEMASELEIPQEYFQIMIEVLEDEIDNDR